jgi:hypothetical protein
MRCTCSATRFFAFCGVVAGNCRGVRIQLIAGLVTGCLAAAGCSDSDEPGASGAVATAEAYVEAIDERDGETFCDLMAPYITGTLELEFKDPDSNLSHVDSCGQFISGFIGYIEDCCPPEFVGASVKSAELGERRGRLQAVDLEIELETTEDEVTAEGSQEVARTQTLRDVVWLAEFDDEWRVAKLSAIAHAASLGFTIGEDSTEEDPLAPPDLEAQVRAYAAAQAESEGVAEEREASYGKPGEPAACEGLTIEDPAGDLDEYVQPAPEEPPPETPQADLRAVELHAEDGGYCIRFTAAGPIEGPVTYGFNLRASASGQGFIQLFYADLRKDGLVRVTSGEDEEQHPIAVPGEIGLADNQLTLVLTPESIAAGEPTPSSTESRPTGPFAFGAFATATLGERRALHDDLGAREGPDYFAYPSGEPCGLAPPGTAGQPAGC